MTYRDPLEAMQAENDHLRQELNEARERLASGGAATDHERERQRWAVGMRCLGGFAMMAPFLAMMTLAEHRAVHHAAWMSAAGTHPAVLVEPIGCGLTAAGTGFDRFSTSIERSARVTEVSGHPELATGEPCTVRVAPVSMPDFNCHVDVVCNGTTVYGALPTGFAHCDVNRTIGAVRAMDADETARDGDAAITVDVISGRVLLEDHAGRQATRVVLALDRAR